MSNNNPRNRSHLAPLAATSVVALMALPGCALIDQLNGNQRSSEFADASAVPAEWSDRAPWLPADARGIRVMESTVNEDAASILVSSGAALSTDLCTEVPRLSAPTMEVPDAPDVYAAEQVLACGNWSVIPAGDGWYGWTPNADDERAASE
jgi:hypothetical protein